VSRSDARNHVGHHDELTSTGWPPSSAPDHAGAAALPGRADRRPRGAEFMDKQLSAEVLTPYGRSHAVLFSTRWRLEAPMDNPGVKLGSLVAAEG